MPGTRLFQILKSFRSVHRVLLTGTPLQNNLAELFMLMHFLDAAKFGALEDFQAEYSDLTETKQVPPLRHSECRHCANTTPTQVALCRRRHLRPRNVL